MLSRQRLFWFYAAVASFVFLNTYMLLWKNYYFFAFNFFPLLILCILLALFSIDKLFLLTAFLTPLAINLQDMDIGLALSLPTEPLLFGIMVLFLLNKFYSGNYDLAILKHPVTIAIFINIFWIAITTLTSELPVVSLKFLIARLWFVTVFYFLGIEVFKNLNNMHKFNWAYMSALAIVIFYTLYNHALYNFDEHVANWIMGPFYNDHTAYAAMLAMFFPLLITYIFYKPYNAIQKTVALSMFALFCVAIILSYTRAAWVSIAGALIVYILLLFKIRFRTLLFSALAFTGIFLLISNDVIMNLQKNKQDASDDFAEHIQSITNISSDASNLERLNRWNCALKMFKERPVVGWGPGTYSFLYAPYQESNDKTIISTNFGTGGNAHSEYLGPLSESGVAGMLSFLIIVLTVIASGFRLFYTVADRNIKMISGALLLGLITYFAHGILNNFLDTDKASAPFWGFIAMLVAIDLYHKKSKGKASLQNPTAE